MQGGYGQPASGLGRSQNPYMPSSGVPAYSSTSAGYGQSGKGGMGQPMNQGNKPAYGDMVYRGPGSSASEVNNMFNAPQTFDNWMARPQSGVGYKPAYGPAAYGQPAGLSPTPPQFGPITPNLPPQQAPGQPPASFGPLAPTQINKPAPNLGLPVQMQPPSTGGMGYDKYRAITGDGFTGVRNGQNFVNGNLFAAEGLNQGDASNPLGAGFGNWLRAHQQYLGGTAASYVPPGGWR